MLYGFIPRIRRVPSIWQLWIRERSISSVGSFSCLVPGGTSSWRGTKGFFHSLVRCPCTGIIGKDQCQCAALAYALPRGVWVMLFSFALPAFWISGLPLLSHGLWGNSSIDCQLVLIIKLLQNFSWRGSNRSGSGSQTTDLNWLFNEDAVVSLPKGLKMQ